VTASALNLLKARLAEKRDSQTRLEGALTKLTKPTSEANPPDDAQPEHTFVSFVSDRIMSVLESRMPPEEVSEWHNPQLDPHREPGDARIPDAPTGGLTKLTKGVR
jgi:hypothetical protein